MRRILLLSAGIAVGFVLGARAGRPAYDRLAGRWSDAADALGLAPLASTVKEAGIDMRDTAVERASDAVASSADGLSRRTDASRPQAGDGVAVGTVGPEPTVGH